MNKGFTLVELLAVIVLLSILSGVVLFSLGSTLNNSKKKLTDNQITTIEKAAQTYYLKEGINDNNNKACVTLDVLIDNGYIDDDKIENFANNNEMNGHVQISYKANQYSYKYADGECPIPACKVITGDGTDVGDEIKCAGEHFYVISNDGEEISMLAKYNLDVGNMYDCSSDSCVLSEMTNPTGIQNEDARGYGDGVTIYYGVLAFSETNYWLNGYYSPAEDSSYLYVYDNNSNLYEYVENYERYLKENGISSATGSLISYEQLELLGCNNSNCNSKGYEWIYSTSYWNGSISDDNSVWYVRSNDYFGGGDFDNDRVYGVRPVISISTNEL